MSVYAGAFSPLLSAHSLLTLSPQAAENWGVPGGLCWMPGAETPPMSPAPAHQPVASQGGSRDEARQAGSALLAGWVASSQRARVVSASRWEGWPGCLQVLYLILASHGSACCLNHSNAGPPDPRPGQSSSTRRVPTPAGDSAMLLEAGQQRFAQWPRDAQKRCSRLTRGALDLSAWAPMPWTPWAADRAPRGGAGRETPRQSTITDETGTVRRGGRGSGVASHLPATSQSRGGNT